jgi:hypothetical protein
MGTDSDLHERFRALYRDVQRIPPAGVVGIGSAAAKGGAGCHVAGTLRSVKSSRPPPIEPG